MTGINTFYRPRHFKPEEFVSRKTYGLLGETRVLRYLDPRILMTADALADHFCFDENGKKIGTATINNWCFDGQRQYSGLRMPGEPHYKQFSDHSFGRALDIIFSTATAQEVRDYIEANPQKFPYITFVEEGDSITWLHIGCSNTAGMGFRLSKPDSLVFWDADFNVMREVKRS